MGANVEQSEHLTTVRAAELRGYGASLPDLNDIPDTAQTLAVVALFAEGETVIRNVGNLRVKETDRMAAIKNECEKLGAKVAIEGDDIRITPPDGNVLRHPDGEPISDERPVEIDTYDDHRMAMSFAIAGLRQAGIRIKDPACVNKTYPNFFDDLATLAGGGNVREPATPSKGS
jgi:3-phosphoshikimate 1-carboxyvinyltransferase